MKATFDGRVDLPNEESENGGSNNGVVLHNSVVNQGAMKVISNNIEKGEVYASSDSKKLIANIGGNLLGSKNTYTQADKLNAQKETLSQIAQKITENSIPDLIEELFTHLGQVKGLDQSKLHDINSNVKLKTNMVTEANDKGEMIGKENANNIFIAPDGDHNYIMKGGKYRNFFFDQEGNGKFKGNGVYNVYFGNAGADVFDTTGSLNNVNKKGTHIIANFEPALDKICVYDVKGEGYTTAYQKDAMLPRFKKIVGEGEYKAVVYDDSNTVIIIPIIGKLEFDTAANLIISMDC
jgi:hypothetical protein